MKALPIIMLATLLAISLAPAQAMDSMQADPFAPSMMKMHDAMPKPTGDIDHDFLAEMIPHHQAAVDMARIELAQGHDPKVKALAQTIINSQQAEITQMQGWLNQ